MKWINKKDFKIIVIMVALALILAGAYYLSVKNKTIEAQLYYDSKKIMTIPLDQNTEKSIKVQEAPAVMLHLYEDNSIAFVESDCPDKVCIHSGRLSHAGQSAACLPNKVVLKIVPTHEEEQEVDWIG